MQGLGSVLGIIPARGGSKGLPGKNLRPLAGLPLIAHSIRCAKMVPEIDRVVVTTDSPEIAEVARTHGAEVPFMRPAELATDEASLDPVLRHAHLEMEKLAGHVFDAFVLFQPTSPARLPSDVQAALALLAGDETIDAVVGCSEPPWNPFYVGVVEEKGRIAPAFPGRAILRRQEAPPFLRVNGAIYAYRRRWLDGHWERWTDCPQRALVVSDERSVDVDSLEDFELLEWRIATGKIDLPWLEASK